jgi:serine protease Do
MAIPLLLTSVASQAGHHASATAGDERALGVGVTELAPDAANAKGLDHGVRVDVVKPGSPAAAAGLQAGDILIEMGGKAVYSGERLRWLVKQAPENEPVPVKFLRNDATQTASVRFGTADDAGAEASAGGGAPGWPALGIRFQPITPDLRSAMGLSDDRGVLVTEVADDGAAKKAGIAVGDVIVRIDRRTIRSGQDLRRAVGFFNPGDTVAVEVVRNRATQVLSAQLGSVNPALMGQLSGPHGGHHSMMGPHGWMPHGSMMGPHGAHPYCHKMP